MDSAAPKDKLDDKTTQTEIIKMFLSNKGGKSASGRDHTQLIHLFTLEDKRASLESSILNAIVARCLPPAGSNES